VNESALLDEILNCRRGSIIAPAGCGKTEQIARALIRADKCRLVLTHTLAGVDAIRKRLRDKGLNPGHHDVTTIAAWCLRVASAFPLRSGLTVLLPADEEWDSVYLAATRLILSGCIDSVIRASYAGVLVDEYQDCTILQHNLICALTQLLPCCIFGDSLQAIFGFRGGTPPSWDDEVMQIFPTITELRIPHRWENVCNGRLGEWLLECRNELVSRNQIDLTRRPPTVAHCILPSGDDQARHQSKCNLIMRALASRDKESCIVIGDSQNEPGRALMARNIKATAIEPVSCRRLREFVDKLDKRRGSARLGLVLELLKDLMTQTDAAALKKVVATVLSGTRRRPLDAMQAACVDITKTQDLLPILTTLETAPRWGGGWVYRRELHHALCSAIRGVITGNYTTLSDAVWDVQNHRRHAGRRFGPRSVGSTLLVKGLEFDHVVVADTERLGRNDLYVALTRGAKSVTIISETSILRANSPASSSPQQPNGRRALRGADDRQGMLLL